MNKCKHDDEHHNRKHKYKRNDDDSPKKYRYSKEFRIDGRKMIVYVVYG